MKRAVALLKNSKVLIQGYSRATSGVWIGTGPVYVTEEGDIDGLESNILAALDQSMTGIPHPPQEEWKTLQAPMLAAAGVKTWASLAKGAKAVGLACEGTILTMEPSSQYERNGGLGHPERSLQCDLSADDAGKMLLAAFEACD